jgi:hypothetical protein
VSNNFTQIALSNFTNNMIILVVENCLVEDIPNILTTDMVHEVDDDELERLAAESEDVRTERDELREECKSLQAYLQFCNKYRERKTTS